VAVGTVTLATACDSREKGSGRRQMRYLYTADDDQLFAYAPGRRDFFRAGDDLLWAHESHGWLVAAESGETLAHRTGDVYYGAVDGRRLYRVTADRMPDAESSESGSDRTPRPRRATQRVARSRH
jgi:hypothetical protein